MSTSPVRDFIAHHDDRWLFVIVYITLAVVLSIALSLFWLVAVAGLHFGLEYARQAAHRDGPWDVATHALWEIKLDVALVLLALALALYMDVVMGLLGLQSAARAAAASRAGARVARAAAWQRNLRAFVLLADDVARIVQIGVSRVLRRPVPVQLTTGGAALVAVAADDVRDDDRSGLAPPRGWRDAWSFGDRFTLGLLFACVLLIVVAPLLTDHSWGGATAALLEQLHPFPSR